MRLYHATSLAKARAIQARGFKSASRDYGLRDANGRPVRVSDIFFADREDADAQEAIAAGATSQFMIEIPAKVIADYELPETDKPYREWCLPAALANRYFKNRTIRPR